jgi:altronate hydrolase
VTSPVIRIHAADNVVIARQQLLGGTVVAAEDFTVQGLVPPGHKLATRNYIGILTSVNCSATAARAIADHFRRDIRPEAMAPFPNVDGVVALTHGMGCATDSEGEELRVLRRTLGGYARHPNFAAVLVVGLGCETNQIQGLIAQEGLQEGARLVAFSIQDTGGTAKTVARGIELVNGLLAEANRVTRQPVPARHLTVGLRWLGRLFRHQCQPGAGRGGRPPGPPRRQRDPQRDPRDLRG